MDPREATRQRSANASAAGRPLDWFEALYQDAERGQAVVPWADGLPHPLLVEWLDRHLPAPGGRKALVVGCGYGDDAVELARRGFHVTAFDVAPTAIEAARRTHVDVPVRWVVADATSAPEDWCGAFDLVVEIFTLQAVPTGVRAELAAALPTWVAPRGAMVVIARERPEDVVPEGPPWPLAPSEVKALAGDGLDLVKLEQDLRAEGVPPRLRATFVRGPDAPTRKSAPSCRF